MKEQIPGWDVRAFEAQIEELGLTIAGTVTHIARTGWSDDSQQYVVEVTILGRLYKFTIMRDDEMWITRLLSVYTDKKLSAINTFRLTNERIEFLFEEALMKLSTYVPSEEE